MSNNKAEQELFEWEREAKRSRLKLESEELFPACQDVLWATFLFKNTGQGLCLNE